MARRTAPRNAHVDAFRGTVGGGRTEGGRRAARVGVEEAVQRKRGRVGCERDKAEMTCDDLWDQQNRESPLRWAPAVVPWNEKTHETVVTDGVR